MPLRVGSPTRWPSLRSMTRRVFPLFGVVAISALLVASSADAHPRGLNTAFVRGLTRSKALAQTSASNASKSSAAAKAKTTKRVTKRTTKVVKKLSVAKKPSVTTVPKAVAPTTVPASILLPVESTTPVGTAPLGITPVATAPGLISTTSAPSTSGGVVPAPIPVATTVGPTNAVTAAPVATSTTVKAPPTTLPPAPYPAPANPPIRATALTMEPYRGLGAWVDRFDWTTQWSKKVVPPVTAATMDQMYLAGIETVYIQAAHWSAPNDVLEPEKLIPMINRAHELGMHVVVWYLPAMQDVNTDLRKTIALANLEVDGVALNIEDYFTVPEINERNRRTVAFSASLRQLLAGRFITINIVEPTSMDAVSNLWTQPDGKPPKTINSFWRGPFPYRELAPYYDLWTIQTYWTNRAADSGWRDGYRYVTENVRRLRANLGRDDVPVHVTGGVGDRVKVLNDVSGFQQAAREQNVVGISFYDWVVWPRAWWPYSLGFRRGVRDQAISGAVDRLAVAVVEPPAYVATAQPPVTTTTKPGVTVVAVSTTSAAPTPSATTSPPVPGAAPPAVS